MRGNMSPLISWASRDLLRHPGQSLLLLIMLTLMVTVFSVPLLLCEAVRTSGLRLLEQGPSLVVRRVAGSGWTTIPIKTAIDAASAVPGVMSARPRLWGTVRGPFGPLTIIAVPAADASLLKEAGIERPPARGEVITGPMLSEHDNVLKLIGEIELELSVISRLPAATSLISHDVVMVNPKDGRRLLGVPDEEASDLAVDVFHAAEEEAILADLTNAFPWPVRIVSRGEAVGVYSGGLARRGSLTMLTVVPSILALVLLVMATVQMQRRLREEIGLLKTLGWTTNDIVFFHFLRGALIGLPAVMTGCAAAYSLVFAPGMTWIAQFIFGWQQYPPVFSFNAEGVWRVLAEISCLIFLPWMAGFLTPILQAAAADPLDLIQGEET